jgi:hypothetical protein
MKLTRKRKRFIVWDVALLAYALAYFHFDGEIPLDNVDIVRQWVAVGQSLLVAVPVLFAGAYFATRKE